MPANWQKWIPFYIDSFRGSPAVQAMSHAQKMAYWFLLTRLPDADYRHLVSLVMQMADRYPHQDVSDSAEGYLWDYERLCLRYSLEEVQKAFEEWRITQSSKFFPSSLWCKS